MRNRFYACLILLLGSIIVFPFELTSKNKYTVRVVQPDAVLAPVIRSVTISAENKNLIAWEEVSNENIRYFNIYRDAANPGDPWVNVGKTMYPGDYSFTDVSSYPNVRSYQYRISTVDQCGNEIYTTRIHKTIKLTVEEISDETYLLRWNPYLGFDIGGYKIYRGIDILHLMQIDSTTAMVTTYIDTINTFRNAFYQVEAFAKQDSLPTAKKASINSTKTRSNIASNRSLLIFSDSVGASKLNVYPNPLTLNAIVIFPYDASQTWQLSIIDLTGHTVYTKRVFSGEIEIERKNLKEGIYILQIAGEKIYRKKLMVGRI
jgi:hypothetical protein